MVCYKAGNAEKMYDSLMEVAEIWTTPIFAESLKCKMSYRHRKYFGQ